jgi:hypothetical protein
VSRQFELKSKPASTTSPLPKRHASFEVGRADDVEERDADRMAEQILRAGTPSPAAQPASSASRAPVAHGLGASLGDGQPLDPAERSYFEPRFGFSFDKIRIHAGSEAARSALSVGASAFALGNDLVFGAERYQPGTSEGRRLLAHELAHVARTHAGADAARPVIRRAPLKGNGLVLEDNTDVVDATSGGKVLKTFMKDDPIEVTGETDNFYEVDVGGQTGFVDHSRVDLPASPFAKHRPTGSYRGIITRAKTTLTAADGERFYHIDTTFGTNLIKLARDKKPLPSPGFAGDGGWMSKHLRALFKKAGWKKGDTFRALITYKEHGWLLTSMTRHPGRQEGKEVVGPPVEEGLEATFIQKDWERRLTDAGVMPP